MASCKLVTRHLSLVSRHSSPFASASLQLVLIIRELLAPCRRAASSAYSRHELQARASV